MIPDGVSAILVDKCDKILVSTSMDGVIKIWDLKKRTRMMTFPKAHEGRILELVWLDPCERFITCSEDKSIKIWDLKLKKCVHKFKELNQGLINKIAVVEKSDKLISASSEENEIRIWSVNDKKLLNKIDHGKEDRVSCIAYSEDEKILVTGSYGKNSKIKIWNAEDLKLDHVFLEAHQDTIKKVKICTQHYLIFSLSDDNAIKIWNFRDKKHLLTMDPQVDESLIDVCITSDHCHMITCTIDGIVKLWDLENLNCVYANRVLVEKVKCMALSPSNHLFLGCSDGSIKTFNLSGLMKSLMHFVPLETDGFRASAHLPQLKSQLKNWIQDSINWRDCCNNKNEDILLLKLEKQALEQKVKKAEAQKRALSKEIEELQKATLKQIMPTRGLYALNRKVTHDGSCLFSSLAYLFGDYKIDLFWDEASRVRIQIATRKLIAHCYLRDFSIIEVDGQSLVEHLKRLDDINYPGSMSDIKILAEHHECSVGMVYINDKGITHEHINKGKYEKMIYLLHDTRKTPEYYEPIVGNVYKELNEVDDVKIFPYNDESMGRKVAEMAIQFSLTEMPLS